MKPIEEKERFTLSKIVSDSLRQYIVDNKLTTGHKLPSERDLASMLDVSRVVVREALRTLESTGIIIIRHGEGAFVNTDDSSVILNHLLFFWQMNNEKIEELFELRQLLEKAAIEQIIEKTDIGHLQELDHIISEMSETIDPIKFKELDIDFHRGLIKATKNELFLQLTDIIVQYFANVSHSHMDDVQRNKAIKEHRLILEALKDNDKDLALHLLSEHLQYSKIHKVSN
nr:FadR/GntR family transcriptional regulator [Lederbergia citrea]